MDILATHHSKKDFKGFSTHTKMLEASASLPVNVEGHCESTKLAEHFKEQFWVSCPLGPAEVVHDKKHEKYGEIMLFTS